MKRGAPGELELVRSFVNTLDHETGADELAEVAALRAWLAARGLLARGAGSSESELRRTIAVREAIRALLVANNGGPLDPKAASVLEGAARWSRLTVVFDAAGRIVVEPGRSGVAGAVGTLLAIISRAMAEGTWTRLKACASSSCAWAFYDHTRNCSGRWCAMAVCGNRTKVRAYRTRRRRADAGSRRARA
jgi:predicted RNA-binding Zn ribbon-like protein